MAVITISRLLGSGGTTIARLIADELGFRLLDRNLVDAVAERAGVTSAVAHSLDEQDFGWASGLIYSLLLSFRGQTFTQESYRLLVGRLIRETAQRENVVILGRAGQVVLGFRPGTFHAHVVAPIVDRVTRLSERDGIAADEARRRVIETDEARRRFIYAFAQRDWSDPTIYDLIVNTQRLKPELSAKLIVDAARRAGVVR